ncbi:MAG TPA: alpha/beta hydrolase [Acidimicrobiales bacterium]|nr:alpha/beta hydrolase [Acidimicrobiales bacterium]
MEPGVVTANGLEFAVLSDGPEDGPLALCLHGFPDTARTWRHLLPRLAGAGYRAVAPYLRGYAPSAVPADGAYDTGTLAVDACELHEALGGDDRAVLVGHDWGAFAAYGAANAEPERWRRVVTAAVPPLAAMGELFLRYDQLRRSFYVFVFQTPLAEAAVSADDLAFIERLWADWSPGYDAAEDVAWVKDSLRDPANLGAAIGYYRAMFSGPPGAPRAAAAQAAAAGVAPQPTLYLHGRDDGCLGLDAIGPVSEHLSRGSESLVVERAGHFLHLERPDEVGDRILAFLGA